MADVATYAPWQPLPQMMEEPKVRREDDRQLLNIRAIIAAIAVPRPQPSWSQDTTPADEEAATTFLLPKPVDPSTRPAESRGNSPIYGTFVDATPAHGEEEETRTVVPLTPDSLLTSAALTPVYLILMLLPMLPFWIFAGFLAYVAATQPLAETQTTLLALAVLLPFNTLGTLAVIRFALRERRRALLSSSSSPAADVERAAASPSSSSSSRRPSSSASSAGSGGQEKKKRQWRPSMQFVLHGARREGRWI